MSALSKQQQQTIATNNSPQFSFFLFFFLSFLFFSFKIPADSELRFSCRGFSSLIAVETSAHCHGDSLLTFFFKSEGHTKCHGRVCRRSPFPELWSRSPAPPRLCLNQTLSLPDLVWFVQKPTRPSSCVILFKYIASVSIRTFGVEFNLNILYGFHK